MKSSSFSFTNFIIILLLLNFVKAELKFGSNTFILFNNDVGNLGYVHVERPVFGGEPGIHSKLETFTFSAVDGTVSTFDYDEINDIFFGLSTDGSLIKTKLGKEDSTTAVAQVIDSSFSGAGHLFIEIPKIENNSNNNENNDPNNSNNSNNSNNEKDKNYSLRRSLSGQTPNLWIADGTQLSYLSSNPNSASGFKEKEPFATESPIIGDEEGRNYYEMNRDETSIGGRTRIIQGSGSRLFVLNRLLTDSTTVIEQWRLTAFNFAAFGFTESDVHVFETGPENVETVDKPNYVFQDIAFEWATERLFVVAVNNDDSSSVIFFYDYSNVKDSALSVGPPKNYWESQDFVVNSITIEQTRRELWMNIFDPASNEYALAYIPLVTSEITASVLDQQPIIIQDGNGTLAFTQMSNMKMVPNFRPTPGSIDILLVLIPSIFILFCAPTIGIIAGKVSKNSKRFESLVKAAAEGQKQVPASMEKSVKKGSARLAASNEE